MAEEESTQDTQNVASSNSGVLHDSWIVAILKWLEASKLLFQNIQPSSVMMGKVWVRLFNGLQAISDECRPNFSSKTRQYGVVELMELFALCTVNSFLVEESMQHRSDNRTPKTLLLKNPRTSAQHYLKQLVQLNKEDLSNDEFPLTQIVARCPLITGLISDKHINDDKLKTLFDSDTFLIESSIDSLKKIEIQGAKRTKSKAGSSPSSEDVKDE